MEMWRDIQGYEGLYQVSNYGRVRSLDRTVKSWWGTQFVAGRILKPFVNKRGYSHVALCKDGKISNKAVHRLVAEAFIPNPQDLPCVDHIIPLRDGGTNCVDNLRWCTPKENINNPSTKKVMLEWANSEENKKRNSERFKGENNPNFNKKGIPNLALSKTVYQYTLDGRFIKEWTSASECFKNGFRHVSDVANGKRKQDKGYRFSYERL